MYALALSFFFLSLLAAGSGCRGGEEVKGVEGKWPGEPKQSPSLAFIPPRRADTLPRPESTAFNALDFAVADGWVPRPRSFPRAHSAIITTR